MGLDMYAWKIKANLIDTAALIDPAIKKPEELQELHYWRKFNNLHGWMERLYRERGGGQTFNCIPLRLTEDD